jgi:S1-C subfamily serine protease
MKLLLLATFLFSFNVFSKTSGFKVTELVPGSVYSQWSLESGDVIQKINNQDVTTLNDLMKYMGNPSSVKSLKVLRDNNEIDIKI